MEHAADDDIVRIGNVRVAFRRRTVLSGFGLCVPGRCCRGVIGLSGDGKSTALKVAAGELCPSAGRVMLRVGARWLDLYAGSRDDRYLARRLIGVVDQDPKKSLNDLRPVVEIVKDPLAIHGLGDRRGRDRAARAVLDRVGLRAAEVARTPSELSVGQLQRVAIARALVCNPVLCLLDEPTSGLDVLTRSAFLELLAELIAEKGLAAVLVTHDLGVVRRACDRVATLANGSIVEEGPVADVFAAPRAERTRELVDSARELEAGGGRFGAAPRVP